MSTNTSAEKKQQNKNTARIVGIAVIFLILLILNFPGLLFFLKPEQREAIKRTTPSMRRSAIRTADLTGCGSSRCSS